MTSGTITSATPFEPLVAVPRRHPWRWISAFVILLFVAALLKSLFGNSRMQWDVVADYFTSASVLAGLGRTVLLTLIAMVMGIVFGTVLAIMHQSGNPVLAAISWIYVWLFRSIPPLVQLLIWYNLAAVYPIVSFGIPFGPDLISGSSNQFITPFVAAILGLGLNEAAYMCEIIRAGIGSVDRGQTEAAQSLGFTPARTMRRVVLPQALKVIIPPTGNETITILKATSLVSVISMADLLYSVQLISARTFQIIPLLTVACIWYLVVTSVLAVGQHAVESRLGRGPGRPGDKTTLPRRILAHLTSLRTAPPSVRDSGGAR